MSWQSVAFGYWQEVCLNDLLGTELKVCYTDLPVKEYSGKEIRQIRMKAGMTQSVLLHIWVFQSIKDRVYMIRGEQVMMDSDWLKYMAMNLRR